MKTRKWKVGNNNKALYEEQDTAGEFDENLKVSEEHE